MLSWMACSIGCKDFHSEYNSVMLPILLKTIYYCPTSTKLNAKIDKLFDTTKS